MFTILYKGFWKKCARCKDWKPDTSYHNKHTYGCRDGKQSYCKQCSNDSRKQYYVNNLFSNRLKNKKNNIKYLRHKSPELTAKAYKNSSTVKKLIRLAQRKARGELVISLVCRVWEVEPEMLKGRVVERTPENIRQARVVATTLFRRFTLLHPEAIADKFNICTLDVSKHGMLMREYTDFYHGDILVLDKINKVRELYREQKEAVNAQVKLIPSKLLPGFSSYTKAELNNWKEPIVKVVEYPEAISFSGMLSTVCWFMNTDYEELHSDKRGMYGSAKTRQVLTYILREYEGWSYEQIGRYFNKDHSTCLHNVSMGSRIIRQEKEALFYELNRVCIAEQKLVTILALDKSQRQTHTH